MSDLAYFLGKPGVLTRTPVLMLISGKRGEPDSARGQDSGPPAPDEMLGALLLYQYRLSGIRTGIYTSNDRSGRNTLVAPPGLRGRIAFTAARYLLEQGAHVTMLSFRDDPAADPSPPLPARETSLLPETLPHSRWALRNRVIPEYLALGRTYDETLATIGQRTRSNLRYYRRRTERELGCTFLPELKLEERDVIALNRACMYAVPDHVAIWRLATLHDLSEPLLMGLRDRDGRLLSLLGGRRVGRSSEILWQMNRDGLPHLSLSLVMRGYFLEHEIGRGAERFYIEGGTPHPIRESFTKATVTDLAMLRRTPTAYLTQKLARHTTGEDNELATMLYDSALPWHRAA